MLATVAKAPRSHLAPLGVATTSRGATGRATRDSLWLGGPAAGGQWPLSWAAVLVGGPAAFKRLARQKRLARARANGKLRRWHQGCKLMRTLTSRRAGEAPLGYSQRMADFEEEEEDVPTTTILDFSNTEERVEKIKDCTRTPVTLLTGFLGSGKTSLLKHVLENQEGVRLGVIVNDMAAVNIDSQLVRKYERGGAIEVAELSNGCVCCTASDDLVASVQELVNRMGSVLFHHIVIELSGVGEPERIRRHWDIGVEVGMPATLLTEIKRTVAVVDASLFGNDWLDSRKAAARNEEAAGHDGGFETVGQLLAEQVEKADAVLVNKTDLASPEELATTERVVRALNPDGELLRATFGRVSPIEILPEIPRGLKYPEFGRGTNYRWAQNEAVMQLRVKVPAKAKSKDVTFNIGRTWVEVWIRGEAVPRLQGKLFGRLRGLDEWLWELDGEGEDRHVAVFLEKSQEGLWEDLWERPKPGEAAPVHEPAEAIDVEAGAQEEVQGTHGEHGHEGHEGHEGHDGHEGHEGHGHEGHEGHGHGHSHSQPTTAAERFGIHSFVYQRRRPFSSRRLQQLIDAWPVPAENKQAFSLEDLDLEEGSSATSGAAAVLKPVLRSKGFCWTDSDPLKVHEWAHAGRTLSLLPTDWWWSVLKEDQLKFQISYPGAKKRYEQIKEDKWDDEWGDRRQELVVIGGPSMSEDDITALLDTCLLDDDEMAEYAKQTENIVPPDTYFGIEGLLRQMGEDPATFGKERQADLGGVQADA